MTVGVPEYSLDSWGITYVKKKSPTQDVGKPTGDKGEYNPKTNPTGQSTPTGRKGAGAPKPSGSTGKLNTKEPHWRDQKVQRPEDRAGGDVGARGTVSSRVGESNITDMHISHGGARGTTGGGYTSVDDTKQTDEYRAPLSTGIRSGKRSQYKPAQGEHLAPKLTIANARTTAYYRARQGGAHGTGTEKHPHTLPSEGGKGSKTNRQAINQAIKSTLNLVIIKCKLLLTKQTYQQGGGKYNNPHSAAGIQDKLITPHPHPAEGKHTKDTKYFSSSGALLGRGETGRTAYEAEHKKTDPLADRNKKPTN